jgi:hypothetical protein
MTLCLPKTPHSKNDDLFDARKQPTGLKNNLVNKQRATQLSNTRSAVCSMVTYYMETITADEYLLLRALHQGLAAPPVAASNLALLVRKSNGDLLAVAEWLTLVVPDKTSRLEYKPTHLFVDQILLRELEWERPVRNGNADVWERNVLDKIIRDSLKRCKPSVDCLARDVGRFLGFIGLMRITSEGDWIPTDRLLNLLVVVRERFANGGKAQKGK